MLKKITIKTENRVDVKLANTIFLIIIVLACLLGAIPYFTNGVSSNFMDAVFESVSAFSTTGASTIKNFSALSNGMKLYRALGEWLGGGVTLIVIATALQNFSYEDNSLEKSSNSITLYRSGIRYSSIIKRLLLTYVILTVVCTLVLWIMGLLPGNSLILAFSCVSTGGFPLYAIEGATENNILTVLLVFMLLTCINYTVYYHLLKRHFGKIMSSTELFAFLMIVIVGSVIVVAGLYFSGTYGYQESVFYGVFESISYASTSGFDIVSVFSWPSIARLPLVIMSLIGGCSLSLGSGLSIMRTVLLFKLISRGFITRIHPAAVVTIKHNGKKVSGSVLTAIFSYFLVCIAAYIFCIFCISFEAGSLEEAFIVTNSLISNRGGIYVGSFGIINKIVMCIVMLLGRFEFYPLMIPFAKREK